MAKVYDPIMCMMVDKPDKAQDAAYEIKEIGEPKYSIDKSKKFGLFVNGKLVARAVSKEAAEKVYETFYKKKAKDELKIVKEDGLWCVYKDGKQVGQSNSEAGAIRIYNRLESGKDSASALDKAIKTADAKVHDSVDIEHIADYLWTWVSGRDIAHELFYEGLDKYSGPHDPEHKKEAYEFARKYAASELNKVYSKLKSVVEKRLKEGFETNKRLIDSYK